MAKQLVGPIERHVEKLVLGAGALVLIAVVGRYLVTSPNQLELDGEPLRPSAVAERVLRQATELRSRTQRASPGQELPEPLSAPLAEALKPLAAQGISVDLPAGAPIGPAVPIIDPPEVILGGAELVKVEPVEKPKVTFGRSTYLYDGALLAGNWVTVASRFNRSVQRKRQADTYGATRMEVVFGGVELQRRAQRPDSTWSDEDWELINATPARELPPPPTLPLVTIRDERQVSPDALEELERFVQRMREPVLQIELLRPLMLDFNRGTPWKFPILTSSRDVLLQDDEFLHPNQLQPTTELADRYGLGTQTTVAVETRQRSPAEEVQDLYDSAQALFDQTQKTKSENDAIEVFNRCVSVIDSPAAGAALKNRARRLRAQAEQLQKDIQRERLRNPVGGPSSAPGTESTQHRELLPYQQVWAHDADPKSIESGHTYQYRMRVLVYNQLAGEPSRFADSSHAQVVFIPGEWSEPTDPIYIEPTDYFFITAADPGKKSVSVDLYRWFEGYWVTNRTKIKLGVGDYVSQETRAPIPDRNDPNAVDQALVNFDTGMVLLDLDFGRTYRDRRDRGGGGVRFAPPANDTAVVLVDALGNLHERWVALDKTHPEKKQVADRVWKPGS